MVYNKDWPFLVISITDLIFFIATSFKMLHRFLTITFFFLIPIIASLSFSSEPEGMSLPLIPPLHPRSPFYHQILVANNISVSDTTKTVNLNRTHFLKWVLNSEERVNHYGEIHWLLKRSGSRGQHVLDMYMGSNPQKVRGVFDTGSPLVWFQSKDRVPVRNTTSPIFDKTKSATYRPVINPKYCNFSITYVDQATVSGYMGIDQARFNPKSDYFTNLTFGCSTTNPDHYFSGVIGAGNSIFSLPRQIAPTDPKFSYCLSEDLKKTSQVSFGSQTKLLGQRVDMFTNRKTHFYYIKVVGIEVNGQVINDTSMFEMSEDGNQGFIIDSGTTTTKLNPVAFNALKNKIEEIVNKPSITYGRYQICYPSSTFTWWNQVKKPAIGIKFSNIVYQVPENRAWEKFPTANELVCLKISPSHRTLSILGYDMLLGVNVGYDPKNKLMYIQQTNCTSA